MDPRTERLIAMRKECAKNPDRFGTRLCDSCSRLADKSCGWWFTMRVPNIPPEDFENHCANYRMGSGRFTEIMLRLEAHLGGKINFSIPALINPDSEFECMFCNTRFRIGDGHQCKPDSKEAR